MARWLRESSIVRIVAGFALASLVLFGFGWLVTGPYKTLVSGFDTNIRYAMRQIQSPMWTSLLLAVTQLGSTIALIVVGAAAGVFLIILRRFRSLFLFIIAMAGQAALHHGFKWLFERARPSALITYRSVESFSFPSGHVIAAIALYGFIAWTITQEIDNSAVKVLVAFSTLVLIFLIGMSRVYIGVHYPTDVLAGFIAGMIWLGVIVMADRRPL